MNDILTLGSICPAPLPPSPTHIESPKGLGTHPAQGSRPAGVQVPDCADHAAPVKAKELTIKEMCDGMLGETPETLRYEHVETFEEFMGDMYNKDPAERPKETSKRAQPGRSAAQRRKERRATAGQAGAAADKADMLMGAQVMEQAARLDAQDAQIASLRAVVVELVSTVADFRERLDKPYEDARASNDGGVVSKRATRADKGVKRGTMDLRTVAERTIKREQNKRYGRVLSMDVEDGDEQLELVQAAQDAVQEVQVTARAIEEQQYREKTESRNDRLTEHVHEMTLTICEISEDLICMEEEVDFNKSNQENWEFIRFKLLTASYERRFQKLDTIVSIVREMWTEKELANNGLFVKEIDTYGDELKEQVKLIELTCEEKFVQVACWLEV